MRQDECYFFNTDVATLYNAYLNAALKPPFERSCKEEPYHTITFGLNYSFKYNFNGGSCIMRFIPYPGGAAVNLRFVLAQAVGGRTGKYAQDLTEQVEKILGISGRKAELNVDLFLREDNKVTEAPIGAPDASYTAVTAKNSTMTNDAMAHTHTPATDSSAFVIATSNDVYCTKCGRKMPAGAIFCSNCGAKLQSTEVHCVKCGTKALEDAAFCHVCGKKLQ